MPEDTCPVRWLGRQAVVTLPEHLDRSNADQVREQLLLVSIYPTLEAAIAGADRTRLPRR